MASLVSTNTTYKRLKLCGKSVIKNVTINIENVKLGHTFNLKYSSTTQ